jgi:hypothetical protein
MKIKSGLLLAVILSLAFTANAEDLRYSLNKVTQDYFNIQKALAANNATSATENAQSIIWDLRNMPGNMMSNAQHQQWFNHLSKLMADSRGISQGANIAAQKQQLSNLSKDLFETLKLFNLNKLPIYKLSCNGSVWLTRSATVSNPYVGKTDKNKKCGNIDGILKAGK